MAEYCQNAAVILTYIKGGWQRDVAYNKTSNAKSEGSSLFCVSGADCLRGARRENFVLMRGRELS